MKKIIVSLVIILSGISLSAQSWFDFRENSRRLEAGLNIGQAGSFTDYARFGMGANILVGGFYLDFIHADPQHKYDNTISDTKWNDTEVFCVNAGYQIPILNWFRIMPLIGYAQTNDGVTDGSTLSMSADDESPSWYHNYSVTPGSRTHYLSYGGGISIQPCEWFSINAVVTNRAIYGGIALNIFAFSKQ